MKIRPSQYFAFCQDYFNRSPIFLHQRFGQAFFNTFWIQLGIESDPELFYMENASEAARYIEDNYVDWDS